MYKISIPGFQTLIASDTFVFTCLQEVFCNNCAVKTDRELLFTEGPFEILRCLQCGLIHVSPQPTESDLDLYYKSFFGGVDREDPDQWNHDEVFCQIEHIIKKYIRDIQTKNILEIGAGYGFFLVRAKELGFRQIIGVEPDCKIASRQIVCEEKITIVNQSFQHVNFKDKLFSVILMSASLEHFKDPSEIVDKCYRLLEPGGYLIIRVPFLEGFFSINRLVGKNLFKFGAPRHLFDFSPKTLSYMLDLRNFQMIDIIPGKPEQAKNIFYSMITWCVKTLSILIWKISNRRYILPFAGSIVAIAIKK